MITELRDQYKELYGKKPHHSWDEAKLTELINEKKGEESEESGSTDQEVNEAAQVPEKVEEPKAEPTIKPVERPKEETIKPVNIPDTFNGLPVFVGGNGLRAGRHLVYKDGKPIHWRESVITTYLIRNGIDSLEFPPNTRYISKNVKTCKDCG